MSHYLSKYEHIIIDFSAMFVNLETDITKHLRNSNKLKFAPTFECDCRYFMNVVPERIKRTYWNNANIIDFTKDKVCNTWGIIDTFELAKWFSLNHGSTLVVEANMSLENRIIFSELNVDVYSWDKECIIKPNEFRKEQNIRTVSKSKDPLPYFQVKAGDTVYSKTGNYILEGDPDDVGTGSESNIYQLEHNSGYLAKIFKLDYNDENVLTQQKFQNIINLYGLGKDWDVDWMSLPRTIVYADQDLTKPVGYLMKKVKGRFLHYVKLFDNGDINLKFIEDCNVTVKDVLKICIQFVSQFMFLTANGVNLLDFNEKNFALHYDNNGQIIINMVDTDSYCYDEYVCDYPTYASSLSRKYDLNDKLNIIKVSDESLFVFIFTKLMLNPDFKPIIKKEFRFSDKKLAEYHLNDKIRDLTMWETLPENIQKLYKNVFDNKHLPSVSVLLYELDYALNQSIANKKYSDLYKPLLDGSKLYTVTSSANVNSNTNNHSTNSQQSTTRPHQTTASPKNTTQPSMPKNKPAKKKRKLKWKTIFWYAVIIIICAIGSSIIGVLIGELLF